MPIRDWVGRLRARRQSFPAPEAPDRERFAADMALAPAPLGYALHFTPRSGSSWLTDICTRSEWLGIPSEAFNPNLMPRMAASFNARDLDEFCAILPRRRQLGGVWGFEITYHQLRATFPSERDFVKRYGDLPAFWLIREDIVAQAVSLAKMKATELAHATDTAPEALEARIAAGEDRFPYDAGEIRRWVSHIHAAETGTEALLARSGIDPCRLSYERNTACAPEELLRVMARHIGADPPPTPVPVKTRHRKIGTSVNALYAARFREEQAEWMVQIDAARAPMLAALA